MKTEVLAVCAGFLVGLAALLSSLSGLNPAAAFLFLLLGLALLMPFAIAALRGTFDPMEPLSFLLPLYAYVYLIKPVIRLARGDPFLFGEENLTSAIFVSIFGLILFYLGYYLPLGRQLATRIPAMRGEISRASLRLCAWMFIALGAVGLWIYMEASGGWREFWARPHGYGGKPEFSTAYIYQLPELMVVGFFLITYEALTRERFRIASVGRVALASLGGIGVYAILWTRRTMIAWALITVTALVFLHRRKRPNLMMIGLFWVLMFAAISVALAYRPYLHLGVEPEAFEEINVMETAQRTLSNPGDEFDSFLSIVTLYPTHLAYDNFQIYLRIFLHPIPRLIWPNKPALFVSSWDEFLLQSGIEEGASESLLGDLYIQWGIFGVLFGMFVSGILWRTLFAYYERAPTNGFMQLLYATSLGNTPSFVMQSAISAFWKWMPFMIPAIIVAYRFSRRRQAA